ncbi:capsule assembly Wzi family protein [Siphonobacter aquaeclarae]|uniref:Capsule assembly protein Wzi n=1 Tax=Siphonobacter aquaeclarae TaxID=563176 RepID=A0A1G9Y382_9BACT|nr:capsule assembly Wzi family protein [Siphonobacter aquaeclarae]SDN03490.1 Capsule assembly protein Wzi [Siphonobacter aquaeclarae]
MKYLPGLLLLLFLQANAQKRAGTWFAELGTTALSTGSRTPFYLRANQFGTVPLAPQSGLFSAGGTYRLPLSRHPDRWALTAGAEGVLQTQNPGTKGVLVQGYLGLQFKKWELYAGRRREYYGLSDTLTGMRSLAWSGNALPIPQVQIGTRGFAPVPFIGKWLAFRAWYAHGWFGNPKDGFAQNVYLHSKGLYFRLGKETWPVRLYAGLNHFAQWGGYSDFLKDDPGILSKHGRFNGSWFAYWNGVVLAKSMQVHYGYAGYPADDFISIDVNRIGNHLGTLDLGAEWNHCDFNVFVYRQSMYEDGSLFYLINVTDGLNGIRYLNKIQQASNLHLLRVNLEWLSTTNQGGPTFDINDPLKRGNDNYFNHSQYQDGWTYNGKAIGTPFIQPDDELQNPSHVRGFPNNRVQVASLTVSGRYRRRTTWELRGSFSENYGTYNSPFSDSPRRQFSGLLRMGIRLPFWGGAEFSGAVAYDNGQLYENALGAFLALRKSGNW